MKRVIIILIFLAALLHVANALIGRPLADQVSAALKKHAQEIEKKIGDVDNGNL